MGYKTMFEQIKTVCAWNSLIRLIILLVIFPPWETGRQLTSWDMCNNIDFNDWLGSGGPFPKCDLLQLCWLIYDQFSYGSLQKKLLLSF